MSKLMNIIRDDIQAISAYHVAKPPEGCIKLDAMESPYDLPEEMCQQLAAVVAKAPIRLYPHIDSDDLIPQIKQVFEVPDCAQVVMGNGSDELIQVLTMLVAKPQAKILSIEPTFVMYQINTKLYGMEYISVDTHPDLSLNEEAVIAAIAEHQPALIFIAYPNNPTGIRYPSASIEKIIQEAPGLVVIDEAYGAFSADSFLPLAGKIENLVVVRTLSKIGGAGLRLGYAAGHPMVIEQLQKIIPPYNMNQLSLAAAKYLLQDEGYNWIKHNIFLLKIEREIMFAALEDIEKISVYPSEANFLTIKVPDAQQLFEVLLANGFLVKKLHGFHPHLEQCLRITIAKPEHNQQIINIIQKLYG